MQSPSWLWEFWVLWFKFEIKKIQVKNWIDIYKGGQAQVFSIVQL
jgi:hypothetical protein